MGRAAKYILPLLLSLLSGPAWAIPDDARLMAKDAANYADAGPLDEGVDSGPPSWAPSLSATVKPVEVGLGDPVTVTIKTRSLAGVSVTLPLKLELGPFSELSREDSAASSPSGAAAGGPNKSAPGAQERRFVLRVAAYEVGELTLPPIELTALGPAGELLTLKTQALPIRVKSLLANEPQPKLKALAPPVAVFQRDYRLLYAIIGIAAVALIVLVTLIVQRRLRARQQQDRPAAPPTPPHVSALAALAALDVESYLSRDEFKGLYLRLSEIIREYIGGLWHFDAMEMTTTEIRAQLISHRVSIETRTRLEEYFSSCDLVKFAKYRPDAEAARHAAAEARALVEQTMAALASTEQPAVQTLDASSSQPPETQPEAGA